MPFTPTTRRTTARGLHSALAALVTTGLLVGAPLGDVAQAAPRQDSLEELQRRREEVRAEQARKQAGINVIEAQSSEVDAALSALEQNVRSQQGRFDEAHRAFEQANAEEKAAVEAQAQAQTELDALKGEMADEAMQAYVSLGETGAYATVSSNDINDLVQSEALLEASASSSLDRVERFRSVQEDLQLQRAAAESARSRAERHRSDLQDRLRGLESAQAEQQRFAEQLEQRLDRELGEADSLQALDATLSSNIQQQQAAIAARLEAQRRAAAEAAERARQQAEAAQRQAAADAAERARRDAAARTPKKSDVKPDDKSDVKPVTPTTEPAKPPAPKPEPDIPAPNITGSGEIVSVGGIRVHRSIAGNLQSLLSAASAAGINLAGGGFRDPSGQIAVRRSNCGSSNYAIYQMPASSCRPPTARPGTSMHERGLAVDFAQGGRTLTRGSAAFGWLKGNAARFGFYNLPSEPWHWSTNGQ